MNYEQHWDLYKIYFQESIKVLDEIQGIKDNRKWIEKWNEYRALDKAARKHLGIYNSVQSRKMNKLLNSI